MDRGWRSRGGQVEGQSGWSPSPPASCGCAWGQSVNLALWALAASRSTPTDRARFEESPGLIPV